MQTDRKKKKKWNQSGWKRNGYDGKVRIRVTGLKSQDQRWYLKGMIHDRYPKLLVATAFGILK